MTVGNRACCCGVAAPGTSRAAAFSEARNQPRPDEMVLRYLLTSHAFAVREEESRFSFCLLSASFHTFRECKRLLSLDSHTRLHTRMKKWWIRKQNSHSPTLLLSTFRELKEAILFCFVFLVCIHITLNKSVRLEFCVAVLTILKQMQTKLVNRWKIFSNLIANLSG